MAKIKRIEKSRKAWKCSKCGKVIAVGDAYLTATPYHQAPIVRCVECGLRSWETSSSDYVQTIGALVEDWQKDYEISETTTEDIQSVLEEQRDQCQDSLDNMPESLQYGPTGELLQERIDNLEDAMNELENIDLSQMLDDYKSNLDDEEVEELEEDEIPEDVREDFISQIDEALSVLEY